MSLGDTEIPVEMTPLADASARGNMAIVELLVESRAEVNANGRVRREGKGGREGRREGRREGGKNRRRGDEKDRWREEGREGGKRERGREK